MIINDHIFNNTIINNNILNKNKNNSGYFVIFFAFDENILYII